MGRLREDRMSGYETIFSSQRGIQNQLSFPYKNWAKYGYVKSPYYNTIWTDWLHWFLGSSLQLCQDWETSNHGNYETLNYIDHFVLTSLCLICFAPVSILHIFSHSHVIIPVLFAFSMFIWNMFYALNWIHWYLTACQPNYTIRM